jgi:hypothetical protein
MPDSGYKEQVVKKMCPYTFQGISGKRGVTNAIEIGNVLQCRKNYQLGTGAPLASLA